MPRRRKKSIWSNFLMLERISSSSLKVFKNIWIIFKLFEISPSPSIQTCFVLEMFPDSNLREHFRFCVLNVMKSSNIFGSGDSSKLVALFYGRILTRQLYPGGPDSSFQPSFPVYHTSFGPWKAECFRCVSLFLSQVFIYLKILFLVYKNSHYYENFLL